MHTDEYEISLSRELAVCTAAIRTLERSLAGQAMRPDGPEHLHRQPDAAAGKEQRQALMDWTARKKEYEALFKAMKL